MHQQRVQNPKLKPLIGFLVIVGIVAVSIIPTVVGLVKSKLGKKNA